MSIASGTRLGSYEIVGGLGAGGMGRFCRSICAEKPGARQRFGREARAISSLNHPHICTLHDFGRRDGTDFIVMEYPQIN